MKIIREFESRKNNSSEGYMPFIAVNGDRIECWYLGENDDGDPKFRLIYDPRSRGKVEYEIIMGCKQEKLWGVSEYTGNSLEEACEKAFDEDTIIFTDTNDILKVEEYISGNKFVKILVIEYIDGEVSDSEEYIYKGLTADEIQDEVDRLKEEYEGLVGAAYDSYEIEVITG